MVQNLEQLQNELNAAIALHQTGRVVDAEAGYRKLLQKAPDLPVVHNNLGLVLQAQKRMDEALTHLHRAIELDANYVDAHSNLGNALRHAGQYDEAVASFEHALTLNPNFIQALGNLGNTYLDMGRLEDSEDAYRRALKVIPEQPDLFYSLGRVLYEQARWDDAEAAFRKTLSINNGYPLAHWNLSHVMLLQGRFREAWLEYEWRWHCPGFTTKVPKFDRPQWDGKDIQGKTILVFAEQGFGDTIQFVRYLPLIAAAGGTVIFLCQPELQRLMAGVDGIAHLVSDWTDLPPFDLQCPLMTLPMVMESRTEADLPSTVPYITAPAGGTDPVGDDDAFKIGLVWAGRESHLAEAQRSLDVSALEPLLDVSGCHFYALQAGERGAELAAAGLAGKVSDLGAGLSDFADTASIIQSLDLVIGVDTAVVHLAGALNKPVWTMLPRIPDWRWMLDREDSPWYASMRLFRQSERGDWVGVVHDVAAALKAQVA